MKLLTLILAVLMTAAAFAATTCEIEMVNGADAPTFQALMTRPLSHGFGTFINVNASETWDQAYAGLTYTPASWVQIGAGAGFESFGSHERSGAYVWMGKGKVSGCYVVEDGASGRWHRLNLDYQVTPRLALGYVNKAYAGEGPTVTFTLTKDVRVRLISYGDTTSTTLMLSF